MSSLGEDLFQQTAALSVPLGLGFDPLNIVSQASERRAFGCDAMTLVMGIYPDTG